MRIKKYKRLKIQENTKRINKKTSENTYILIFIIFKRNQKSIKNHNYTYLNTYNYLQSDLIRSILLGQKIHTFIAFYWYKNYLNRLRIRRVMIQNRVSQEWNIAKIEQFPIIFKEVFMFCSKMRDQFTYIFEF